MVASIPPPEALQDLTAAEVSIAKNSAQVASLIATVSMKPHKTNPRVDAFALEMPVGTTFVGHTNTDMDSVASSIGAAHLFDGHAAKASSLNTETIFALDHWGLESPPLFETCDLDKTRVCLMDHNQESQITPGLDLNSICGVIDHHALQSGTVITDKPIYIDIRPWGSACTIVAHTFLRIRKPIPATVAGILLSGILSDTLNLRSPTTTDHDRLLVAVLAKISACADINELADKQFAAKSAALMHISPYEVACGDQKKFNIKDKEGKNVCIGFGVVETTDPTALSTRIDELMIEVAALKSEQKLDYSFLAIVDIVKLESKVLLIGRSESELAVQSFGLDANVGADDGIGTMVLENMVSRKLDFIPRITMAIVEGFLPSEPAVEKTEKQKAVDIDSVYGVVNKEWSLEACCSVLVRRVQKGTMKRVSSFANMATPGGGWANLSLPLPAMIKEASNEGGETPTKTSGRRRSSIGGALSPVAPEMYAPETITTGAGPHSSRASPSASPKSVKKAELTVDTGRERRAEKQRGGASGGGGGVSVGTLVGAVGFGVVLGVVVSKAMARR